MGLAQAESAASADTVSVMLIVAGIVVIAVLMMISIRGKIAARQAERPGSRETLQQIRTMSQRSDDSHQASAAFYETAQRLMAQLDNKAERLEQLIEDADERLARLESQFDGCARDSRGEHVIEPKGAPADEKSASANTDAVKMREPADPLARSIYQLADDGRNPVEIAQQLDEQIGKVELILALRQTP